MFPDVHSIYFADQFGLPWETALTWDPAVLDVVVAALEEPGSERVRPARFELATF